MWEEPSVVLTISAFFTSILSGMLGMGGGILLLTIMMSYYPPTVLIPIHGVIQWVSNASRIAINLEHVVMSIFIPAFLGSVLGGAIASQVVWSVPESLFRWIIGVFILLITWVPFKGVLAKIRVHRTRKFFSLGAIVTFISLFVGATGPLLAPFFLQEDINRKQIVATKASVQFNVHTMKILVFFFSGFLFSQYISIIISMSVAAFLGTYVGKKLLGFVNEKAFRVIFKTLITLLALRVLYKNI